MKARIYSREGHFSLAKTSLASYVKAKGKDKETEELEADILEGEKMKSKTEKERNAELWNACVESASQTLRIASHSIEVRTWRAECSLAAGDIESTVGDLTCVSLQSIYVFYSNEHLGGCHISYNHLPNY